MDSSDAIPDTGPGGTVILLNGPSSSGKSSIALELLDLLDGSWFHMPIDAFHAMRNERPLAGDALQAEIDRTAKGFHRAVAGMAAAGNNLVADYPLSRRWRLLDLLDLLVPDDTLLVGVRCPLPVLERREAERGDREPGLAARQFPEVHSHELHDLDVDTDTLSARQCAVQIREALEARPRPAAFTTLRDTLLRP
ncbi:chloramphenicol phosphotransferase CPT family protein [Actinomadura madurae]|uniref:chloramphenicol phosphotransferase CPT family protein n=1 Tax=Actinomadura madurae TaxID=1993 RepID=UPI002026240B|nr:AAA family ATPase [Actinomadura madurae]MCP9954003.1 chloramphenicol phosphotransferase CPT family protein [Actinomadura madurae]MCP9983222.1 chloramphenicol phosphotransferase CPT family protein [Actinomadura madurae]MCQ0005221.1 chloramphenicol phosphotransferase CPT family protein [Actinomadura madurae]URM99482.1 chloramphenicol phosphotransferase CPT family protein [Actinomadura madurae]